MERPRRACCWGGSVKLGVYSYDIKFGIVSSGNVNPSWKLINLSTNASGAPLFSAGRTRTHDLTLTFGPSTDQPTLAALQAHFTSQVVQSNQRQIRPSAGGFLQPLDTPSALVKLLEGSELYVCILQ